MAASILLACGLNETKLPSFIFLDQESGADGSFLINCILSQRLKMIVTHKLKIVLFCCHQTFEHYSTAGLRLGYNLQSFKENKRIETVEPLSDLYDQLFMSNYIKGDLLDYFKKVIVDNVNKCKSTDDNILLIFDDLSFLCDLGMTEKDLIRLTKFICELCNTQNVKVILKLNNSDNFYSTTSQYLDDFAEVKIKIERLKSGKFREVDGKLSVMKLSGAKILERDQVFKTILYKVTDKAVKIFAPGEVGIKM